MADAPLVAANLATEVKIRRRQLARSLFYVILDTRELLDETSTPHIYTPTVVAHVPSIPCEHALIYV